MLIICPTPIGNIEDISRRQLRALKEADIIACEDTRRAGKLLELLGIERVEGRPELWRYDDHTAPKQVEPLLQAIDAGRRVVLISDAGTPTISDPGYRLVRACRQTGRKVEVLPGPVAAVVALSGSGLASDRFVFQGFLPSGRNERLKALQELEALRMTVVAYESPRRIVDALEDVESVCGQEREVCVARELTKIHEEFLVGPVAEVRGQLQERQNGVRGEIVLCLSAAGEKPEESRWEEADRAIAILDAQGLATRTIKDVVCELFDVPRSQIYDRIKAVTAGKD